jgi:hypothetical protein
MANRVTGKMLEAKVKSLNEWLGFNDGAWIKENDKWRAVIGAFSIDHSMGGYCLCQVTSDGGGERQITMRNSAAVTMELISAYWQGIMAGEKMQAQA